MTASCTFRPLSTVVYVSSLVYVCLQFAFKINTHAYDAGWLLAASFKEWASEREQKGRHSGHRGDDAVSQLNNVTVCCFHIVAPIAFNCNTLKV